MPNIGPTIREIYIWAHCAMPVSSALTTSTDGHGTDKAVNKYVRMLKDNRHAWSENLDVPQECYLLSTSASETERTRKY